MNEKDEEELKQIIINCPDFETCPRIDDLRDRDMTEFQFRDGVLKVCRRCLEEKGDA